jgi:hypothetical protein
MLFHICPAHMFGLEGKKQATKVAWQPNQILALTMILAQRLATFYCISSII